MSKLQLLLLGHFECLLPSGERISLSMRKAEVLLAYLALAPGIRHPRERLINLLWSDRGEEQARNSLRQCLSAIRKSLGEAADLLIQVDRTTVCLIPEMVDVDALEFERLATIAEFESLSDAAALYRGEFLEGISIRDAASQEWLDSERGRFKRQYIEILTNLGHTLLASHDFNAAIRAAEKLVVQDALGEPGWRLLMCAYSENGDRSHALQAFKRCQQALRSELEVEPETATLELRDQIANSQMQPAKAAARDITAAALTTEAPSAIDSGESGEPERTSSHSIAVLPFDNLSGDPEQEYFSDGITDSIILNLSLFPDLQVKSRHSSFAFKQQIKSPGEISAELDVDYLVEGSIRRSSDRVRITVQLIEAASGTQIWGKRYDADLENLFDLEEELSRTIAATVTGQIESDLRRIAIGKSAEDQQSYDLLLAGKYHALRFNRQDNLIAIDKLNQCIQQDPANVRAHAQLYSCHSMDYLDRWTLDYQKSFELAKWHIEKAMALNPELEQVRSNYAEYLVFAGDPVEAGRQIDKVLQINPNNPETVAVKAVTLIVQEDFKGAMQTAERALQLDPHHPWAEWELAGAQYWSGRYESALQTISAMRTDPGFTYLYAAASHAKLGREETARELLQDFLRGCEEYMLSMPRTREEWLDYCQSGYRFKDLKWHRDMVDCLVEIGLTDDSNRDAAASPTVSHNIAVLPFDNLSGDPGQEYFSDGITDSIILNLSLFPELSVKSRNASFAFKQQLQSVGEISRKLGVDYVVEGSIRKSDDQVRITVQLIEGESGNQVWGKRYDAPLENLFALEEELSRSIAATVTGQIYSDMQRIAIGKAATNLQAYDLLLAGIYHHDQSNAADNRIAIEKLNRCLELDPDNARAHLFLYHAHMLDLMDRWVEDYEQSRNLAEQHILKAVSLEPREDRVLIAHADYLTFWQRYDEGQRLLKQVLQRNPNNAEAIAELAVNLSCQGEAQAALEQAQLAIRLDPYQPWYKWIKAESLLFCERYEDCIETIRDNSDMPGFIRIYAVVANVRLGRCDSARAALGEFLDYCREQMAAIPQTIEEWRQYYRANAPMADPAANDAVIDCLVQAGLTEQKPSVADNTAAVAHTIAVLPFDNLSGDPAQEYFSDGITESIIFHLERFPGLSVKSRHSSFAFKQQIKSLGEISAELGVAYLVEGSIRKSAEQIRVTVQLVDAASGNQVWGKRYDAPLDDLFRLEEELSRSIAATVTGQIESDLQRVALSKRAQDQQAYDLLLCGIYHNQRYTPEDTAIAIEKLDQCLQKDPDNAMAHAWLYVSHLMDYLDRWTPDHKASFELGAQHIRRARSLLPDDTLVQVFYAQYLIFCGELAEASKHLNKLVSHNPDNPTVLTTMALNLELQGQASQALVHAERACELDPYHPWAEWELAGGQYHSGLYEKSLETTANMRTTPGFIQIFVIAANIKLGKKDRARQALQEFLGECRETMQTFPRSLDEWMEYTLENYPFADAQYNQDIVDCLVQAGLCDANGQADDDMPSIAVLPFANLSGDAEQEYFSDGITSSLILSLGMFKGLNVKSQASSFAFKQSDQQSSDIARELAADFLIEGSIRKSGSKVRLAVQLVESESDTQIWGKQYDAELVDILDLEQELSATVAATISGRIGHRIQQSAVRKPASSLKSYDYLLRGLYHMGKFTAQDMEIAQQQIEKCIELEPDNAEAHMQLGMIHSINCYENWTRDRANSAVLSGKHLEKALEIAPDNAQVQAYYSEYLFSQRDYERAEFHADKAIELNPTAAEGYIAKADILAATRRYEEALELAAQGFRLDPNAVGTGWVAGEVYRTTGHYDKAIKTFRSIQHTPTTIHALIAACLAALGKTDQARSEMHLFHDRSREEMPHYPDSRAAWRQFWKETSPYKHEQDFEDLFALLLQAGLCEETDSADNDIPSIAVLPFENMSGEAEQQFFSDAITSDIISTLSKFRHMRTVARHSTDMYRNREASIAEIAADQGVRYILEGSVRRSGNRIRVSAELVDAQSEQNCWSERYDRDLDDLFAVQDEITREITLAMKVHLDDGDMALQRSAGTSNIKAWELTLTAIDLSDTYIRRNIVDARAMIKQALELDPDYSYAWVMLAWTYWQEVYSGCASWQENLGKAEAAVQHALDMNPDDAAALNQSAFNYMTHHDADKTLEYCRRSVELEPGNAEFQGLMAMAYIFTGNYDLARVHQQKMQSLCPVMPNWYYLVGAQIEQYDGDLDQAIAVIRQGIAAEPDSPLCRFYLVHALMRRGDEAEAKKIAEEIRALDADINGRGLVRNVSIDAGLRDSFHADLAKFGLV